MSGTKHPKVIWAQRNNLVFLTVDIPNVKNEKIHLDPVGKLHFEAESGTDNYLLDLEFFAEVDPENTKWIVRGRNVQFSIEKKDDGWWDRLTKESQKLTYLSVDWNKWKDEDDSEEEEEEDLSQGMNPLDLSSMMQGGGMGGMPGMPGMEGMGGMPGMDGMNFGQEDDDDSDDMPELEEEEEEEETK